MIIGREGRIREINYESLVRERNGIGVEDLFSSPLKDNPEFSNNRIARYYRRS